MSERIQTISVTKSLNPAIFQNHLSNFQQIGFLNSKSMMSELFSLGEVMAVRILLGKVMAVRVLIGKSDGCPCLSPSVS